MEIIIKATNLTLSNYNETPSHNFLYTDGFMANGIISYSVTNETYPIKAGLSPQLLTRFPQ